jgi:hypothetical protein
VKEDFSREDAKARSMSLNNFTISFMPHLKKFPFASSRLRVNQNKGGYDE